MSNIKSSQIGSHSGYPPTFFQAYFLKATDLEEGRNLSSSTSSIIGIVAPARHFSKKLRASGLKKPQTTSTSGDEKCLVSFSNQSFLSLVPPSQTAITSQLELSIAAFLPCDLLAPFITINFTLPFRFSVVSSSEPPSTH